MCIYIISYHWQSTDSFKSFVVKRNHLPYIISAMAFDDLANHGARVPAAMVLNKFSSNIPVSAQGALTNPSDKHYIWCATPATYSRLNISRVRMAVRPAAFLYLLVVCFVQHSGTTPLPASDHQQLKVSAFNIEILGVTKMSKPEVVEKLVEVGTHCWCI